MPITHKCSKFNVRFFLFLAAIITLTILLFEIDCSQVDCLTSQHTVDHSSHFEEFVQYQMYLRGIYRRFAYNKNVRISEIIVGNRPIDPVNLVLVYKNKRKEANISHTEQVEYTFQGKISEIQKRRQPMKIEEIGFSSEIKPVAHFVLIEGAPGIGKSTLCWQLCRLWSEGKLKIKKWNLVVLVELKNKDTKEAMSDVYDLLYHPNDSIREAVAQEVQKRDGEGLLLIFDGYDELSGDQRSELSVFHKILKNMILTNATIIVASRPIATKFLPSQFKQNLDQHIEIAGFNETDIQTYITLACENDKKLLEDFQSYIANRPFVLSVMYNPLHCTIVTELYIQYWQDKQKGFAPNTLTELYNALILNLLRRSLPDHQSNFYEIEEISDLPTYLYNNLLQLAEIAAKGLKTGHYIYNSIPYDTLGLMVSVRQLYDIRPKRSAYMFLHQTLQEYLAALHLHSLSYQQLTEFMQQQDFQSVLDGGFLFDYEHDEFDYEISMETNSTHVHWPLFLFLAGLTKFDVFPLDLMLPGEDLEFTYILSPLCQLLFEAQSPQTVTKIFAQKEIILDELTNSPLDWFVLGYCIANSGNTSTWIVTVSHLVPNQLLQMLSNGMRYATNIKTWNEKSTASIKVTLREPAVNFLAVFPNLYPFTRSISELRISSEIHFSQESDFILQDLSYYCPNLEILELPAEFSSSFLMNKPKLPQESLISIKLTIPYYNIVFDSLHEYQSLNELHLLLLNK